MHVCLLPVIVMTPRNSLTILSNPAKPPVRMGWAMGPQHSPPSPHRSHPHPLTSLAPLLSYERQDKLRRELNKARFQAGHLRNELQQAQTVIPASKDAEQMRLLTEENQNLKLQVRVDHGGRG